MENKKIVSSLAYKSIEQLLNKGLGLIISIVLARLLSPDDFGQLAILTVFINLSQTIVQSGFSSAVVQTKELHKSDYSTTFYISTLLAILMVVILFFCAPFISRLYETEALTTPLRVYSITLLFGAFNSVQLAKLQREMRFKETMITRTVATVLSGAIGIYCAFAGFGLWALVRVAQVERRDGRAAGRDPRGRGGEAQAARPQQAGAHQGPDPRAHRGRGPRHRAHHGVAQDRREAREAR